ncbi:hypothetical protein N7495_009086 [Penicillium taxi]|uniref:uncharacterized protein n=1 Tax=Penicillium taxi TaxID=168475 RepID=UPI002545978C|nr:uncharacterized protein N7495_009086 [Penicillium taxi]KAJ5889045.1 hypothetical protein N7495_009086 [Penicillium taxi]
MYSTKAYSLLSFILCLTFLCALVAAAPTDLDIRPPGDLKVTSRRDAHSLMPRGSHSIQMIAAPLIAMASLTLSTCRYLHIASCYVVWSLTIATAAAYSGYSLYDIIKRDFIRATLEMSQLSNSVHVSNREVVDLDRKYDVQKSKDSYEALENVIKNRRRSWQDKWKIRFAHYKELANVNTKADADADTLSTKDPELVRLVTKAADAMSNAIRAENSYMKAEDDSVTLEEFLDGEDGTLSTAELREVEKTAETAVTDLRKYLTWVVSTTENHLGAMNEMAFGNKDYNPSLSTRSIEYGVPRMVEERNENCDNQLCHRMWLSVDLPGQGKKRNVPANSLIHNIYSTPVDYEFKDNTLKRRDLLVEETDIECEEETTVKVDGKPVLFRLATMPGNYYDLEVVNYMNKTQIPEFQKSLMSGNMTNWGTGEWMCVNAETDNVSSIRGVAIFTEDEEKLHQDVTPMFQECVSRIDSAST